VTPAGWGLFRPFGEALRLLTILPTPGLPAADEKTLVRSLAAFPVAGLVVGALGAAAGALADVLWGPSLRSVVVVVVWMIVTAGLHLDGLADSADALFSWRSRERKLEIMKDSRIGTMGALALIAVILLEVGALASLGPRWWRGALLAPVCGRWAAVYAISRFPAARPDGMARTFHDHVRRGDLVIATAFVLLIGLALVPSWRVLPLLALWPAVHGIARRITASLGGLTGDTHGFVVETCEVLALLVLGAVPQPAGG